MRDRDIYKKKNNTCTKSLKIVSKKQVPTTYTLFESMWRKIIHAIGDPLMSCIYVFSLSESKTAALPQYIDRYTSLVSNAIHNKTTEKGKHNSFRFNVEMGAAAIINCYK